MLTLKDSVTINRPPDVIFAWLAHFPKKLHIVASGSCSCKMDQGEGF